MKIICDIVLQGSGELDATALSVHRAFEFIEAQKEDARRFWMVDQYDLDDRDALGVPAYVGSVPGDRFLTNPDGEKNRINRLLDIIADSDDFDALKAQVKSLLREGR